MTWRFRQIVRFILTGHWFAAWKWATGQWPIAVYVSDELIRDSAVDVEASVKKAFSDSL